MVAGLGAWGYDLKMETLIRWIFFAFCWAFCIVLATAIVVVAWMLHPLIGILIGYIYFAVGLELVDREQTQWSQRSPNP